MDNCYDDRFKGSCCEYCRNVFTDVAGIYQSKYNTSAVQCIYFQIQNYKFSSESVIFELRQMLSSVKVNDRLKFSGCEYGDKATWCGRDVPKKQALCYGSEQLCCSTCPKYRSGDRSKFAFFQCRLCVVFFCISSCFIIQIK